MQANGQKKVEYFLCSYNAQRIIGSLWKRIVKKDKNNISELIWNVRNQNSQHSKYCEAEPVNNEIFYWQENFTTPKKSLRYNCSTVKHSKQNRKTMAKNIDIDRLPP